MCRPRVRYLPVSERGLAGQGTTLALCPPLFVEADHLADAVGVAGREVVQFGAVFVHVVQLPCHVVLGDELPLADTHGTVAFVLPEYGLLAGPLPASHYGQEAFAFDWGNLSAIELGGVCRARGVDAGGGDVGNVHRAVIDAALLDAVGPVDDEGRGYAAFLYPALEQAEGRVADIRPGEIVAHEGVVGARAQSGDVAGCGGPAVHGGRRVYAGNGYVVILLEQLGAATVVRQEQEERVVVLAKLAQPVHDTAYALINAVNLRGVHRHSQVFPVLMAYIVPVGRVEVAGAYLPLLVQ